MSLAPVHTAMTTGGLSPDPGFDEVEHGLRAIEDFAGRMARAVARAVDDVVDPVRTGHWRIEQLSQPEKTYIGTRVEITLRSALELERAKHLDVVISGHNVDIKFTLGSNWQIPREARNQICLLVKYDETKLRASAGLFRVRDDLLNKGENRDKKKTISALGRSTIRWLACNIPIEKSVCGFMAGVDAGIREQLTDTAATGQTRVNRLFLALKGIPIPREVVQAIAQQPGDPLRRTRADNSNKRNSPEAAGIDILNGHWLDDRRVAEGHGLALEEGYYMSVDRGAIGEDQR